MNYSDINNLKPYKLIENDPKKPKICYKFSHLIKLNDTKDKIIINDIQTQIFEPIITLSTNTDYLRDLKRDSFAILKFIEDNNELTDNCVDADTKEDKHTQANIVILKLAKISKELNNNNVNDVNLLQEHDRLKTITNRIFNHSLFGGFNKELTVEIYEYLLKNYHVSLK